MPKKILIVAGALPPKVLSAKSGGLITQARAFDSLDLAIANHSTQVFCTDPKVQGYLNRQYARDSTVKPSGSDFFDCLVIVLRNIPNKGMAEIKEQFVMPSQAMVQQMSDGLIEQPA